MKTNFPANHTRRPIIAAFAIGMASLVSTANLAMATEVVLVAVAPTTTETQKLEGINVRSSYDASMRSELVRVTHYPNNFEARSKELQGKVCVEFEIDRRGAVKKSEVVQSSKVNVLDAAALTAVSRAQFSAFPENMLPDAASRRYQVTFDYRVAPQK